MTSADSSSAPAVAREIFDPFSEDTRHDIYARYKLLRDEHPAYYNRERDFWTFSRYDDVQSAARDPGTFSSAGGVDLDNTGQELQGPGDFLELDPPRHDQLRNIIRRFFTPKSIAELRPLIEREVAQLVDSFAARGSVDLVHEVAWPLPVHVGSSILGIPREDQNAIAELFRTSFHRRLGDPTIPGAARHAAGRLHEYFAELSDLRRRKPKDDVISVIAQADIDGQLLAEEVTGMSYLLFSASIETTSSLISNSLHVLASHPDQRQYLWDDPERIPNGVEELLRFITPVQNLMRTTTRDVEIHSRSIPRGARVVLLFASANRDERRFERPDELDVSRAPKRHLGFGEGIHFCLGAPLARLEACVALAEIGRRIPDYSISGPIQQVSKQNERGLTRLPAVFPVHQ